MLYKPTNENLKTYALEPTMRWLIAVALDGFSITYGEIKERLESEIGFSKIFTTRIGWVAGTLMEKIQKVEPQAPLINILVVDQTDRLPGHGAGSFIAKRFGHKKFNPKQLRTRDRELWEKVTEMAAGEVYKYSEAEWQKLYLRAFGKPLSSQVIRGERQKRRRGVEEVAIADGGKYGSGGEGKHHLALRLWVKDNPSEIRSIFAKATTDTEVLLESGDRVDVVYKCKDKTIVIEVKSRISDDVDLRRGVFQCVKYRAVRQAMDVRQKEHTVEAFLVTESPLPKVISELVKLHGITHYQAPQRRNCAAKK